MITPSSPIPWKTPSEGPFPSLTEFPSRSSLGQFDDPFGGMSGESRGPNQLALPRTYAHHANQDPRTNLPQHGGAHHVYPPSQTYRDGSPHNPSMGSTIRSARRDDELMVGNHRPSYLPNVRRGYPADQVGEQDAYPSQSQIWAELRRMSAQIATLEEAETRRTQPTDCVKDRLDSIEKRLSGLEADGDGPRAKRANGASRATSNQHPMLKVSRLQLYSPQTQQININSEVLRSPWFILCSLRCVDLR